MDMNYGFRKMKIKNQLIKQKVIKKKKLLIYQSCHYQKVINKEGKEGKGLKILTPNKLLTRLPVLLVQIKAGNKSYKLKHEIRQILYLLYQHNKINKNLQNKSIK